MAWILLFYYAMFLPFAILLASTVVLTNCCVVLCRYSGDSRCIWGPGSGREHVDRCIRYVCLFSMFHYTVFISFHQYFSQTTLYINGIRSLTP